MKKRPGTHPYNRAPPDGPDTLKTTSKAVRAGKNLLPKEDKREDVAVVVSPPVPTEKIKMMKTVLVASYGWPTADMQPSRRQMARR